MTKTCSKCNIEKQVSEFHYRKDSTRYRNQCKECWKYITASRRYGVTFQQAKEFYGRPQCMCCQITFTHKKQQHLHHVNHKVYGVLCMYCNLALGQETEIDKHRIKSCLNYLSMPRDNPFDRANQQGRPPMEPVPSTTTCPAHLRECKMCSKQLPLTNFYRQKYKSGKYGYYASCKECHKIFTKTYKYGLTFQEVKVLRSTKTCNCCERQLRVPYIHHIGTTVLGVLCRECNILLEQELSETQQKLESCYSWMMMI